MQHRRLTAWLALLASIAASAIGFFWYASTALPYQDPTPDVLLAQAAELQRAQALFLSGLLVGAVTAFWLWQTRKKQ